MRKINQRRMYRQGDIMLVEIPALPRGLSVIPHEDGRLIVARGEATGHHHSFPHRQSAVLFRDDGLGANAPMFVEVKDIPAMWEHQEHATIPIPPGAYRVVRQREYSPQAIRRVED